MRIFATVVMAVLLSLAPVVGEAGLISSTTVTDNGLHVSDGFRVANAGPNFGLEPDPSVIVNHGGLEWIWAAPCASEGASCGTPTPHHDFRIPTREEWASWASLADLVDAFETPQLCGSPWMSSHHSHCDTTDFVNGHIWHAYGLCNPAYFDGCEASTAESFYVRGAQQTPGPATLALVLSGVGLAAWMSRRRMRSRRS